MPFSHVMKQNFNTCNSMDETWKIFYQGKETWQEIHTPHTHTPPPHTHTLEYYLAINKIEIMLFAAIWVGLEIAILSASQREINIIWYHLYVESKKVIQMNLFTKQK